MPILTLCGVSAAYDHHTVLSGVTFALQEGDTLAIVGPNGSGKSTLAKAILGLLPLQSGSISWGEGISPRQIGYLAQQTQIQKDFPASVQEVVLSGRLNHLGRRPFLSREDRRAAQKNMVRLGIDALAKRSYRDLSGGQQQRVLLARALCATEKLLLLDEPATGLDPLVTVELYQLIDSLKKEKGLSIIMVTHDIAYAVSSATKLLHLEDKPLFFGTPEEYRGSELGRRFLGGENHA